MTNYSELIWIIGLICTAAGIVVLGTDFLVAYITREPHAKIPWKDSEYKKLSFVIPWELIEHVDAWVHEFSELTIMKLLPSDLSDRDIESMYGQELIFPTIQHILVSFHSIGYVDGRVIQPEEFEREFSLYQPKPKEGVDILDENVKVD